MLQENVVSPRVRALVLLLVQSRKIGDVATVAAARAALLRSDPWYYPCSLSHDAIISPTQSQPEGV